METCVKSENAEAIQDYLMSGGPFSYKMVPRMYLKKLFDQDSLIMFDIVLQTDLTNKAPHSVKTLVETVRNMVLSRTPHTARLTNMIERTQKINQMGYLGENMLSYTKKLILEMDQSGWSTMSIVKATILY